MNKLNKGKLGEEIAEEFLKENGYKIIKKNFRTKSGEIDLICEKNGILIFVEVRTKGKNLFMLPEESITKKKIDKIKKTSLEYLASKEKKYKEIKFEFIGIEFLSNGNYIIKHIKDFIY